MKHKLQIEPLTIHELAQFTGGKKLFESGSATFNSNCHSNVGDIPTLKYGNDEEENLKFKDIKFEK